MGFGTAGRKRGPVEFECYVIQRESRNDAQIQILGNGIDHKVRLVIDPFTPRAQKKEVALSLSIFKNFYFIIIC